MANLIFACVHVADGSPIWLLECGKASNAIPVDHLQACCEVCAPSMTMMGPDDIRVLDRECVAEQLEAMIG